MAEHLEEAQGASDDFAEILRAVNVHRTRLGEFAAQQREKSITLTNQLQERLDNIGAQLAEREQNVQQQEAGLQSQQDELQRQREEFQQERAEFEQQAREVDEREAAVAKRSEDLDSQSQEIERSKSEMLEQAAELDEEVARVAEERTELDAQRSELAEEIQQLAERREHLQTKLVELDSEREEYTAAQQRTEEQRRRLAERMQARRKEIAEQRAQLIASAGSGSNEKLETLQGELTKAQQRLEELEAELESSRARCQELEAGGGSPIDTKELEQLAQACRRLEKGAAEDKKHLAELQQQLEQSQADLEAARAAGGGDGEGNDEYRQRYEMAVADLREERARISDLEAKLANAKLNKGAGDDAGDMDWEAQKRRLLASLESDFDEDDEQSQQDKLSLEEAIRVTDRAVAAKERELEQLQQLLEQQSANVGNMAVGAAAVADLLDKDELIQQERENLKQIQQEWRDKLRQSEIDISLERAKLARDKAQLEEKLREFETEMERMQKSSNGAAPSEDDKKGGARGNWLTRMGLKGDS